MNENELSKIVLDIAFDIHTKLGPGLFESVYETVMAYELVHEYGLNVQRQKPIPVIWKGVKLDLGFRSDLIVNNRLLVELKSIESLAPVHAKQVLTHIKLPT
jgi:GxxExxY protein